MKRIVYFICYVIIGIVFSSCSKNEDDQDVTPQPTEETRYYIKYEVNSSSWKSFGTNYEQKYTFTTEKGTQTITKTGSSSYSWEATYGPFKKGESVSLNVTTAINNHAIIYASRDKEPFVIKAEQTTSNKPINLSYTIDF